MQQDIVIAGFGGQGILFASHVLAQAAMLEGKEVAWIPSYGPEMRGGTANCTVIVSDHPVGSLVVRNPRAVIVMNLPSLTKYEPLVRPDGLLLVNSSLVSETSSRQDIKQVSVGATEAAVRLGNDKLASIVMLGTLCKLTGLASHDYLAKALDDLLPPERKRLLEGNVRALQTGAEFADEVQRIS